MFLSNRFQLFFYFFIGLFLFSESLLICSGRDPVSREGMPGGTYHRLYGWMPQGSPLLLLEQAAQAPLVQQMPTMQQHPYGYQQPFASYQMYQQPQAAGYQGIMPQPQLYQPDSAYQNPALPYGAYQMHQQPPQGMMSQFHSPAQQFPQMQMGASYSAPYSPVMQQSVVAPIPEQQQQQELVLCSDGRFLDPLTGVIYEMVNEDGTPISADIENGDRAQELQKKLDEVQKVLAAQQELLHTKDALLQSQEELLRLEREKKELQKAADQREQELKQKEEAAALARRVQLEQEQKQQQKLEEQRQLELQKQKEEETARKAKEEQERKEQEERERKEQQKALEEKQKIEKELQEKRRLEQAEVERQKAAQVQKEKEEQQRKVQLEEEQKQQQKREEQRQLELQKQKEKEELQKKEQLEKEAERKRIELQKQQEAQKQKQEDVERKKKDEADLRKKQQKADQERKRELQRQQEEQKKLEEEKKEHARIKKAEKEAEKIRKQKEAAEEQKRLAIKQKSEEERLKQEEEYRKKKEEERKAREQKREAARAAAALKTTVALPDSKNKNEEKKKKKVTTTELEDQKPVEYKPFIISAVTWSNMFCVDRFNAVRDVVSGSDGMQPICPALIKSMENFFKQEEEKQQNLVDYILKRYERFFIPGLNVITGKMEKYASHGGKEEYKDHVRRITDVLLYFAFIEYLKRTKTNSFTDLALNNSIFTTVQTNLTHTIKEVEERLEFKISAEHGATLFPQYMESLERVCCFQVPFGFPPKFFMNKGETLIKLLAHYSTVDGFSNKQFERLEEMVNAYTNKIGISAKKVGVVPKVAAQDGVAGYGVPGGVSVVPSKVLALNDLCLEGSPIEIAQAVKSILDGAVMVCKDQIEGKKSNPQQPPSKKTRDASDGTNNTTDNSTEILIVSKDDTEAIQVEMDPNMLSELRAFSDLLASDSDFVGANIFQQPTDLEHHAVD